MHNTPRGPSQRRLDIGLVALALFTVAAVIAALVWDSRPAQSTAESSYAPPPVELPQDNRETVLFIGDSYTAGARATPQSARWTTVAARELSWKEQNIGFGGTGYYVSVPEKDAQNACGEDYCPSYTEALAEYDGPTPDLVVIAGGRNDLRATSDEFAGAVNRLLDAVTEQLPDAEVYVVNPVWDDDLAPGKIEAMTQTVREAVAQVDARFLDIGQPLAGEPGLIAEDGVHPNNEGHAALADAFVGAVE